MTFDKWFHEQSTLIKVLLLIIPFANWITEILVRLSVSLRTKEPVHIVMLVVFVLFGFGWILSVADLVYMMVTDGKLFLTE